MGKDSFLFLDPMYPHFNGGPIPWSSGIQWHMYIPYDNNTVGTHPVMHPVMSGLSFYQNGNLLAGSAVSFGGLDVNGFPYVNIPSGISTDVITVKGPCFITARFEGTYSLKIDSMVREVVAGDDPNNSVVPYTVTLGNFKIVEVFE